MGVLKQEMFMEDKSLRDTYATKIKVLDKAKRLSMLPDNKHMTTKMVAEYYEVDKPTIDVLMMRHKEEFLSDGLIFLSGSKLRKYKSTHLQVVSELKRVPKLTIFNRRCILRVGMMLRDSEVAKQVRTYLLNVEEESSQQQKSKSARNSKWDGKDLILYDMIVSGVKENKTLTEICEEASKILEVTPSACRDRYSLVIKKRIRNFELINKIESNKRGKPHHEHYELPIIEATENDYGVRPVRSMEIYFDHVVQMMLEIQEYNTNINESKMKLLESENKRLMRENSSMRKSYRQLSAKHSELAKLLNE